MDKDDTQQPGNAREKQDPPPTGEDKESSPGSTGKPAPRRSGVGKFLFFLLILILAAGATAYYYEQKQRQANQAIHKHIQSLAGKVDDLARKTLDTPRKNTEVLHTLIEKFELSQVQVADATQRQTEAIEALRQEIDQLEARLDGGPAPVPVEVPTAPVENVPPAHETPVAGDQDKTPVAGDPVTEWDIDWRI